ncbi:MAG: beta-glucosidase BglX [Bacteroidia bacterium]|nr:beta-glucosidase BglX [Bacteroidia bacterium]
MKKYLITFISLFISLHFVGYAQDKPSDMDTFIKELMEKMTLQEKIGQLNLLTPGGDIQTGSVVSADVETKIKSGKVGGVFGISSPEKTRQLQDLAIKNSRLKIPLLVGADVIHGYKTTYPIPLGLSCSWDMALIEQTAQMAAQEATADGIFWNFSPMVDITRDPRWGRVSEGSGEDPYLGSEIAKAMVKGYQGDDLSAPNTMMATVKHFALYGAAEAGRDYNTVDMSRQRMYNVYLPPYKAAVEAGVGCVMSSFNDVEGIPASANKWLLTDLLRGRWGFDGFVVSDYTSVNEMVAHGMGDLQAVSALALTAGLDMDMVGEGFLTTFEKSLNEGIITEADINSACRRVLEAKYKLGLFKDAYLYSDLKRPENDILNAEHRALARRAAAHSMVLLKNENDVLPLKKTGSIALIGPLANDKNNMLGTWAPTGDPQLSVPILEGFQKQLGNQVQVRYAQGANISDDPDFARKVNVFGERIRIDDKSPEALLEEAVALAKQSDVVVAVIGEASEMSGESASRTNIDLPESQKKLVEALAQTGKPLVLVMFSGRPLAIREEVAKATALLQVWFPGVEAGNAIADVLFGGYNPSGKLTMSFPYNVGQIPIYYNRRSTGRPQEGDAFQKFRTNYLDAPNSAFFPFGYGLSYTQFEYNNLLVKQDAITKNQALEISVDLGNTGNYDGEEVVQLYIQDVVASLTRPIKELKGFRKVMLKKGESQTITFSLPASELGFYDNEGDYRLEPGQFKVFVGGNSREVLESGFVLKE